MPHVHIVYSVLKIEMTIIIYRYRLQDVVYYYDQTTIDSIHMYN